MRGAVTEGFGGVDRVVIREVEKPAPGPGEVLVWVVRAASMNPLDCRLREGWLRFIHRLKPPFVLGVDIAGGGRSRRARRGADAARRGGVRGAALRALRDEAKAWRACVTAVASAGKQELLRELGADESGHASGKIVVRP